MSPKPHLQTLSVVEDYTTNEDEIRSRKDLKKQEDIHMGSSYASDTDIHERYKCMLCSHIMLQPIQTFRGNLACNECYNDGQRYVKFSLRKMKI